MDINNLKNIDLTHFYFGTVLLKEVEKYKKDFLNYKSINLSKILSTNLNSQVLFIEIQILNKVNFKILNDLVKNNISKDIYIFSTDSNNNFLLKFALHFSLNKIYPLKDEKNVLDNILFKTAKKLHMEKEEKLQIEISKKINSFFPLLILKTNKFVFANEKAKELFNSENISEIENILKNNEEIYSLISKNEKSSKNIVMENIDREKWNYSFFLDVLSDKGDKLITVVPQNKVTKNESFLSTINRFQLIERLKDKLVQNSIDKIPMSLMTINISNYAKLVASNGNIAVYDFIKKFINKLCLYKNSCQDLAQWNPHLFVIMIEGESFKEVKKLLDSMHQKLIYSEIDDGRISPIVTSSALNIDKFDINNVLHCLEMVSDRSFTSADFNKNTFFEINHFNDYLEENEQIKHYFKSCIGNETPIKLLNIYKGLCINTNSKIIKAKGDSYFVHCENLQGYSMQFENKTIIQAPDLPNDIQANIVYVNIKESYALLDSLVFLESSANNRQNTRVQPNLRTPITMKYKKNSYQGDILDISTKAIAIKLNHSLNDELKGKDIDLTFKLVDNSKEDGCSFMDIEGKVVFVSEMDITKTKIVTIINPEKPYDSYLLKYMYDRQKELILELKRAVKANKRV